MESDRKKAEVRCWAERNWEKLYEQAKSENAALAQSYAAYSAGTETLQAQMMAGNPFQAMSQGLGQVLFGNLTSG